MSSTLHLKGMYLILQQNYNKYTADCSQRKLNLESSIQWVVLEPYCGCMAPGYKRSFGTPPPFFHPIITIFKRLYDTDVIFFLKSGIKKIEVSGDFKHDISHSDPPIFINQISFSSQENLLVNGRDTFLINHLNCV